MRKIDVTTPHFTDRVAEAQQLVASRDHTPALADADRELLSNTLRSLRRAIDDRGAAEQLLHGEPHPGNVLNTKNGLLFIDLETCCRGPVEFDLAHVPEEVSEHYPGVDHDLLRECRILVLAMVTAWRWDRGDQLPNGRQLGTEWLGHSITLRPQGLESPQLKRFGVCGRSSVRVGVTGPPGSGRTCLRFNHDIEERTPDARGSPADDLGGLRCRRSRRHRAGNNFLRRNVGDGRRPHPSGTAAERPVRRGARNPQERLHR